MLYFEKYKIRAKGLFVMPQRFRSHLGCLSLLIIVCLAPLLACVGLQYADANYSARAILYRVAGVPPSLTPPTNDEIRTRLLGRIPIGTPALAVVSFLEASGVERDQFRGGQSFRYQVQSGTILGLFSEPPYLPSFFCSNLGYILRFELDEQERLRDITLQPTATCL